MTQYKLVPNISTHNIKPLSCFSYNFLNIFSDTLAEFWASNLGVHISYVSVLSSVHYSSIPNRKSYRSLICVIVQPISNSLRKLYFVPCHLIYTIHAMDRNMHIYVYNLSHKWYFILKINILILWQTSRGNDNHTG